MKIEIVSFKNIADPRFELVCQIRTEIFVREQKVSHGLEFGRDEDRSTHYLIYCNNIPMGTGRYHLTEEGIKIERFAILKDYRRKKMGWKLLKKMLEDIKKAETGNSIYLNSQESAVDFYLRCGLSIAGDSFVEADIVHYRMEY